MIGSDAWTARRTARALVAELARRPGLLQCRGIDLAPALEHALFTALRDGVPVSAARRGSSSLVAWIRIAARWLAARRHRRPRGFVAGAAVLVPVSEVHISIWRPVAAQVEARGVATGVAWPARAAGCKHQPESACATAYLAAGWLPVLARHARAVGGARGWLARRWEPSAGESAAALAGLAVSVLPRLALAAAQLETMLRAIDPAVVVAYNEVGPISRLVPAVAHNRGIAALDLPHAEAADAAAIAGIDYDAIGVFGDRAREVMVAAGVPAERIVAVGAPHVDELLRAAGAMPRGEERRVVFASQVIGGRMTSTVKERTVRAALAIASEASAVELVIRPHPLETDDVIARVLRAPIPAGVRWSVEPGRPLAAHLPGAWALVTAWSNTAYEAAALGVPVIAVNATAGPPVLPLAEESLALGAVDEPSARDAARRLLDTAARDALVRVAAQRVTAHLGPLDGRSAERAAELVAQHVRRRPRP